MPDIQTCTDADFDTILAIVNDGAEAYRDVIPADRWHEPYMPQPSTSDRSISKSAAPKCRF